MKNKGIRKIKSPYLRQAVSTGLLMILVVWLGNFRVIVEGLSPGELTGVSRLWLAGTFIVYLGFVFLIFIAKEQTLKKIDFYPYDFEESDERERYITAKAARRSFYMMEFILGAGAMFAMYGAAFGQHPELRYVGYTMAALYIVMHLVYLAAYKKEAQ